MQNVWIEINYWHYIKNSFAEESKSFSVIEITIYCASFKIILIIEKIIRYTAKLTLVNPTILVSPRKTDISRAEELHLLAIFFGNLRIKGQYYANIILLLLGK